MQSLLKSDQNISNFEIISEGSITKLSIFNPFDGFFPCIIDNEVALLDSQKEQYIPFKDVEFSKNGEKINYFIRTFEINSFTPIPIVIFGSNDIIKELFEDNFEWYYSQMDNLKRQYFQVKEADFKEQKHLFKEAYNINYDVINDENFLNFVLYRIKHLKFNITFSKFTKLGITVIERFEFIWNKDDFSKHIKIDLFHQYCQKIKEDFYNRSISSSKILPLQIAFDELNFNEIVRHIHNHFTTVPYDDNPKNDKYWEGFFRSNLFSFLRGLNMDIIAEEHTGKGRSDLIVKTKNTIYCFEVKLGKNAEDAKRQIIDKGYLEPYEIENKNLVAFGLSFSSESRNIEDCKSEVIKTKNA